MGCEICFEVACLGFSLKWEGLEFDCKCERRSFIGPEAPSWSSKFDMKWASEEFGSKFQQEASSKGITQDHNIKKRYVEVLKF